MTTKLTVLVCLLAVSQARFINIKRPLISDRIIGGVDAQPGEFPHQVSLQIGLPSIINYTHFCGGSIINERWILTAVHCIQGIEGLPIALLIIKAGKHVLSVTEPTEQESHVEAYYLNENYTGHLVPAPYDVALIKLMTPLRLNEHVSAISLPAKDSEPSGKVVMSGWGAVVDDKKEPVMSDILQKANLEIVDRATCRKAMAVVAEEEGEEFNDDMVDETNICTGPLTGGVSPCSGDSGGPLISKDESGKIELVGVASWGMNPCGRKGAPAVYVKVASVVDWIQDTISTN